ncbi:uncharacterized protein FOMMEDRAFT_155753 [Fomitiporia mediterranea MF3/22]|uniref:uncharacterized protein n=1 Tax=Fomitiporia mediterranea (strain MF3/22) TaxID=694068 RepID=UPI0004408116|nr:uncharacterized protein FOMMEDRAFT_155753 [Fomitiporia mediterranea MF3/22]EJD04604.1 hypothetical protein FOMMEDRAFT_155753 [Fomitiporia mediterranea MF3/22]
MRNNFANNSRTSSRFAAQAIIDKHMLATMFIYNHSQCIILSPIPRALPSLPVPCMTSSLMAPEYVHLYSPVPCMTPFRTEAVVHHLLLLSRVRPPSTLPSLFEPVSPRDTLLQFTSQFTALLTTFRSQSMQRARTDTASPAAQINSFNSPDVNPQPGALLSPRPSLSRQTISQPVSRAQAQLCNTHNLTAHIHTRFNMQGPSDDRSVVTKTTSSSRERIHPFPSRMPFEKERGGGCSSCRRRFRRETSASSRPIQNNFTTMAFTRKREHEEIYSWYVYQLTRSDKSKKRKKDAMAVVAPAVGKASDEKEGKKKRRERTESSSSVRGSGAPARNSSSCSTATTVSVSSSASTDYSEFNPLSADSSLHGCSFGYLHMRCSSVREVEMADFADCPLFLVVCLDPIKVRARQSTPAMHSFLARV